MSAKPRKPRSEAVDVLCRKCGERKAQDGSVCFGCAEQPVVHSRARAGLEAICAHLRNGTPINHACALESVPRQSFYNLLEQDEDAAVLVAKARAEGAETYRSNLVALALGGGAERANANVLLHLVERLYPDEYAPPKQRVESSGPDGKAQEFKVTIDTAVSGASGEVPE